MNILCLSRFSYVFLAMFPSYLFLSLAPLSDKLHIHAHIYKYAVVIAIVLIHAPYMPPSLQL